jgi:hypothetical protein
MEKQAELRKCKVGFDRGEGSFALLRTRDKENKGDYCAQQKKELDRKDLASFCCTVRAVDLKR